MKTNELMTSVTRSFHKVGFQLKKHSPEILVVAGVVGTVASAVMACRATTKISTILDETKDTIDTIHETVERAESDESIDYTVEDSKKDLAIVYAQTGLKFVKLYAPAVALGTLSIVSILASNNILRKRNVALAAAYTAVNSSFKEYRDRVVERFGRELDRELRYNIKAEEIEETVVDEDGKETTVKTVVNRVDPSTIDDTSKIWYEGNPGWTKDPELNLMYLKQQQAFATDKLRTNGVLFLNEVYDMLGYPKTPAGAVLGWIYDEKHPVGDNFVDFGLYDVKDIQKAKFLGGVERNVVLEFNHDGYILDKMWRSSKGLNGR